MESGKMGRGSPYLSIVRDMINKAGVLTSVAAAKPVTFRKPT